MADPPYISVLQNQQVFGVIMDNAYAAKKKILVVFLKVSSLFSIKYLNFELIHKMLEIPLIVVYDGKLDWHFLIICDSSSFPSAHKLVV